MKLVRSLELMVTPIWQDLLNTYEPAQLLPREDEVLTDREWLERLFFRSTTNNSTAWPTNIKDTPHG